MVPAWQIMACKSCIDAGREGVVPVVHPRLVAHLETLGVPIELDERGWIRWPA